MSDDQELATPPWTTLRTLEAASWGFENDESGLETKWLRQLLAPGSSLGGARPKATVKDEKGNLWIAKFPSKHVYALGQWIVKEQGEKRAKYGQYIIRKLSAALTEKYGRGFLEDTLKNARKFYLTYRDRISETTFSLFGDTLPFILSWSHYLILMRIERVMRLKWGKAICLKPDRNVLLLMRIRTIKIPIVDFSSSSFTYLS